VSLGLGLLSPLSLALCFAARSAAAELSSGRPSEPGSPLRAVHRYRRRQVNGHLEALLAELHEHQRRGRPAGFTCPAPSPRRDDVGPEVITSGLRMDELVTLGPRAENSAAAIFPHFVGYESETEFKLALLWITYSHAFSGAAIEIPNPKY
jgi:hypothetical protein